MSRVWPLLLGSMVMGAACGAPPSQGKSDPGSAAIAVTLDRASLMDVPSVFDAGGIVRARLTATVASRVLAPIVEVRVRPGDRVGRGGTLIELDPRELDVNRRRAEASVSAAGAGLHAAESDVAAAGAALTQARATRDRMVALFETRSATAQERDDATAAYLAADAHVTGARARETAAVAALDVARSGAEQAGIAASYATLTAPFDGIVAARHADPGDMATPGAALLIVESGGAPTFDVTVDEARIAHLALRQPVRVSLDGFAGGATPDTPIAGRIVEIARVDADSHSFVAKIALPDVPGLRSGLAGRAEFDGPAHRALVVPASAVVRRGQLAFVFSVDADRARLRQVSPGATSAAGVEIMAGVSAGEFVVRAPGGNLTDGARVSAIGGRR